MPGPNAFGIDEERHRIIEFLQDRPRNFMLRFPAVVEGQNRALRRDRLLAASPGEEILHGYDGDILVLQLLHLRLERLRGDLRIGSPDTVNKAVVTENDDLRILIDRRLRNDGS